MNTEAPTRADAFDLEASYDLKIETNGVFETQFSFHVSFATLENGGQTATVCLATDTAARGTGLVSEVIIQDIPVSFTQEAQNHHPRTLSRLRWPAEQAVLADPDCFV